MAEKVSPGSLVFFNPTNAAGKQQAQLPPVYPNTLPSQQPQFTNQPPPNPGMTADPRVGGNRNVLNKPFNAINQRDWSFGLFDCFSTWDVCLFAWCCPCFSFGQTQSRYHHLQRQGTPHPTGGELCSSECLSYAALLYCGCPCFISMGGRRNIRERYSIQGDGASDCLLHTFCCLCTLTQESREVTLEEQSFVASKA